MLSLEDSCVYITEDASNGQLVKELAAFGIEVKQGTNPGSLHLSYSEGIEEKVPSGFVVWADSVENLQEGEYFDDINGVHRNNREYDNVVQVKGVKNLAVYAAKILSLQKPELKEKIKKIEKDKRETYKERNLTREILDIWNERVGGK